MSFNDSDRVRRVLAVTGLLNCWFAAPLWGGFTDVAVSSGTNNTGSAAGVAWADYDNDGYLDLYIGGAGALYRNLGNGTFATPLSLTGSRQCIWGDFDGDGDLDLKVTGALYRNEGSGTFSADLDSTLGITGPTNEEGQAWIDYDNDGLIDLFIPDGSSGNFMFRNLGNGTFASQGSNALGITPSANGDFMCVGDYTGDGKVDMLYRITTGNTPLWKNGGSGTFTESATAASLSFNAGNSCKSGLTFGDYDNDGDLDLYVGVYCGNNVLFANDGDGTFTDVTTAAGVAGGSAATRGVVWGDYDNDGDLDLYVGNESAANQLFRNNNDGTFTEVAAAEGVADTSTTRGVAFADFDNDGDLDLYVSNNSQANRLYRNDLNDTRSLFVKARGAGATFSSVDGIGSRVRLYDAANTTLLATREVNGGRGYGSQDPLIVHFGVDPTKTFTVRVRFNSGTEKVRTGVVPQSTTHTVGSTSLSNTLEVFEGNNLPVASAGTLSVVEDSSSNAVTLAASDADADTLSYIITVLPTKGTLVDGNNSTTITTSLLPYTLSGGTSVKYTPMSNLSGSDSFQWKANDGTADSSTATVSITVTAVNDSPTVSASSVTINEDSSDNAIVLVASDIENDTLSYIVTSLPALGILEDINGSTITNSILPYTLPSGTMVRYTPEPDFTGTVTMQWKAKDAVADSATATVTITVNNINDAPRALFSSATVDEDSSENVLTFNSSDSDGDVVTFSILTLPAHGQLFEDSFLPAEISLCALGARGTSTPIESAVLPFEFSAASTMLYTPSGDYSGVDSFSWKVSDGSLDSEVATYTISVVEIGEPPAATESSVSLASGSEGTTITLAATDVADDETVTYVITSLPAHGMLLDVGADLEILESMLPYAMIDTNTVEYIPTLGFVGDDFFEWLVSIDSMDSQSATVNLTVVETTQPPTAPDLSETVDSDAECTLIALSGEDGDGSSWAAVVTSLPLNGELSDGITGNVIAATDLPYTLTDGELVVYKPDPGFVGVDLFFWHLTDGVSTSNSASMFLAVGGASDASDEMGPAPDEDTDSVEEIDSPPSEEDPQADAVSSRSGGFCGTLGVGWILLLVGGMSMLRAFHRSSAVLRSGGRPLDGGQRGAATE